MTHHEFSPSALEQFRLCPASYEMQKGLSESSNEYADEGTMLHKKVATKNLENLNEEQGNTVQQCLDFLNDIATMNDKVYFEQFVEIKDENGDILTTGTADVIILHKDNTISVIDWKFGYTPVKSVLNNIQLASYAVGAMQKFDTDKCYCYVFQPRIHKKSAHVFTNKTAIISNIKKIIEQATSDSKMTFNATEESCRYCKARLQCPAFRCKYQGLLASKDDFNLDDTNTLEKLYDTSQVLKKFINDIEKNVKKIIEEKGQCGKYIYKISDGSRKIEDLNKLYAMIKDFITPKEFNELCSISITSLEGMYAEKLVAEAKLKGEKLTKTDAKKQCFTLISSLITRGDPTKKIVEVA